MTDETEGTMSVHRSTVEEMLRDRNRLTLSTMLWDVTKKCDLSCIHCFNTDKYRGEKGKQRHELNTEQALDAVSKIADMGFKQIHMLGGEPLNREDLPIIIEHAISQGITVTINSNGVRLSEEMSTVLMKLGVRQIAISLDGPDAPTNNKIRGKGVFERVTKNLKQLTALIKREEIEMETGVTFTLTRHNWNKTAEMFDLATSLGADVLDIMELYIAGEALKHEDLRYTWEQDIEAYEILVDHVRKNRKYYPKFIVQVDTFTALADYLERKYRANIIMHPKNMGCMAATDRWIIEVDGLINPCGICDTEYYNSAPLRDGRFTLQEFYINEVDSLEEVLHSEYFQSFLDFRNDIGLHTNTKTCIPCEHRAYCRPCPFLHYKDEVITECESVQKKVASFEKKVLSSVPLPREDAKWRREDSTIEVWDEAFQDYRSVTGIGNEIWDIIQSNGSLSVSEIVSRVVNTYSSIPSVSQVRREIVDFIWWLHLLDAISLNSKEVK